MTRLYLDHNASSPLRPSALRAMTSLMENPMNASAVHDEGRHARAILERTRALMAGQLGCQARDLVFTAGGSEACNQAIKGWQQDTRPFARLLVSAVEHDAVRNAASASGIPVETIAVNSDGVIDLMDLEAKLSNGEPALVCVMMANNETGVLQPIKEVASLAHDHAGLVFCDAVQAIGKVHVNFTDLSVDLMAISAHKFGGPLGAGALIASSRLPVAPLIDGGGQELRRRSGTENVPAIFAMGHALEEAAQSHAHFASCEIARDFLEAQLRERHAELVIFGQRVKRLPQTSCFALPGVKAETLLMALDLAGVSVSSGSACSSGKVGASHVLAAMGVSASATTGAIRLSLGWSSDPMADCQRFLEVWQAQVSDIFSSAAE